MARTTTFNVVKAKDSATGKRTWHQVGTLVLEDSEDPGSLTLNFLDGDYAVFARIPGQTDDGIVEA